MSWFLLYLLAVLHATMCIRRGFCSGCGSGFVSVVMTMYFFLWLCFFLLGVSIVIVCGEQPVIVPSGIIFRCGAKVGLGSLVFRIFDFLATFFLLYIIFVVWSPMEKWSSEGVILRGCAWDGGMLCELSESPVELLNPEEVFCIGCRARLLIHHLVAKLLPASGHRGVGVFWLNNAFWVYWLIGFVWMD